jgi:hypothetical protein
MVMLNQPEGVFHPLLFHNVTVPPEQGLGVGQAQGKWGGEAGLVGLSAYLSK